MTATYNTGKPCRNGHLADRYVSSKRCVQCVAEKHDRYYATHADLYKKRAKAFYNADLETQRARRREYYAKKKDDPDFIATRTNYAEATREYQLALKRAKSATPEAKAERARKRKEKAAQYRAYGHKRRAKERKAVPPWASDLDDFVFQEATALCDLRTRVTGVEWQLDHMIPLLAKRASGLHCAANVQVIPTLLNRRKNNKMMLTEPLEWLQHL